MSDTPNVYYYCTLLKQEVAMYNSDLCSCISFLQVDVSVGEAGVNTLY